MSDFTELRSRLLLWAAGLDGFTDARTAAVRLTEQLGDALEICCDLQGPPRCVPRPDGGSRIYLPFVRDEQVEGLVQLHELGHAVGQGSFARAPAIPPYTASLRDLSFQELWKRMRETEASDFVTATLLPAHLVQELRTETDCLDVLEVTGLDRGTLADRIRQVRGRDTDLPGDPPGWSAWWDYWLEWVDSPTAPRLQAVPHSRLRPAVDFPCPARELEARRRALSLDLVALTTREFELKYAAEAVRRRENVTMHWWDLAGVPRKWRRRRA